MTKFVLEEDCKIGHWKILKRTEQRDIRGNILWLCECVCGTSRSVPATRLANGYSKHCGCQTGIINGDRDRTHGLSRGPKNSIYLIWQGIKNRCLNEKSFAYKDYGGRGIKICDEWKNDFQKFYDDMSETYTKGLTIERNDVNGNYEKLNCCWITRAEQANNRRTTIYIDTEKYGRIKIKDAAWIVGIGWQAMYVRIKSWPKERWFEKPR